MSETPTRTDVEVAFKTGHQVFLTLDQERGDTVEDLSATTRVYHAGDEVVTVNLEEVVYIRLRTYPKPDETPKPV